MPHSNQRNMFHETRFLKTKNSNGKLEHRLLRRIQMNVRNCARFAIDKRTVICFDKGKKLYLI